MPTVLHNLAPNTDLNPVTLWNDMRELRLAREAAVAGGGPIRVGAAETAAQAIIRANDERKRALRMLYDWEKLFNLTNAATRRLIPRNLTVGQIQREVEKFEDSILKSMRARNFTPSHLLGVALEVVFFLQFMLYMLRFNLKPNLPSLDRFCQSDAGDLRKLLMILETALKTFKMSPDRINNLSVLFDVLWAIEV